MARTKYLLVVGVDNPDDGSRVVSSEIPFDTIAAARTAMLSLVGKVDADAFDLPGAECYGDLDPESGLPIMGFSIEPYDDEVGTHHDELLHFDANGRGVTPKPVRPSH